MQIIKINPKYPSFRAIKSAIEIIKKGGIIIYPTDTIYGIGANALNERAIKKVYKVKERPKSKPFSIVISGEKMAKKYCAIEKTDEEIFKALLPGPFTLIFPAKKIFKKKVFTIFKNTLSIRVPDFKLTKSLAANLKIPFTATSANISGLPGSGDIGKVLKQLENKKNLIDLVLDAGILPERDPSTIIDFTGVKPKIIRK